MSKYELNITKLPNCVRSVIIGLILSDGYIVFTTRSKNGLLVTHVFFIISHQYISFSYLADSGLLFFKGISLTVWTQFKEIFDRIRAEKRFNLEEMCLHVAMEIRALGGKIKKTTVQEFYKEMLRRGMDIFIH